MTVDAYAELRQKPESERASRLQVRCAACGKLLAELLTSPWMIRCPRCKADNRSAETV
jgi:hypothetical protein